MIIEKYLQSHTLKGLISSLNQTVIRKGKTKNVQIYNYLINNTKHVDTNNIIQRLYIYINKLHQIPKCQFCNSKLKFKSLSKGYSKTCSKQCAKKHYLKYYAKQNYWKNIEKIKSGIKNISKQKKEIANKKRIQTNLKKYNTKHSIINQQYSDVIKKGYNNIKNKLNNITQLYSKDEVTKLLLSNKFNYKQYLGKGNFRKLIKQQLKLYKSILIYTQQYKKLIKHYNFTARLLIASQNFDISENYCLCRKHILYNPSKQILQKNLTMSCCHKGGFGPDLYKIKYRQNWQQLYNQALHKRQQKMNNTFKNKKIQNITVSKVSKQFFQAIYKKLKNKENIYTAFLNQQYCIYLNKNSRQILKNNNIIKHVMYLDFKQNNKVIQFNGQYWHRNSQLYDSLRKQILQKNYNLKVLYINELQYYKNKKDIISKCVNFLENQ